MAWVLGIGIGLFLLFSFPRATLGLVAVLAASLSGFLLWTKLENDAHARERASILVTVEHDVAWCSDTHPLAISISNGSERTLERVTFRVEGHRKGYSTPLYEGSNYVSDRIIPPGKNWGSCWTAPQAAYAAPQDVLNVNLPVTLVWTAKVSFPTFGPN